MADVATEIVAYLISQGVGTALGTDWFIDSQPDSPNVVYTAYHAGGPAPVRDFGSSTWTREYPTLQLRFRGAPDDSNGPWAKAQAAYEAISGIMASTLSGTFYYYANPAQVPFQLRRDEQRRVEWAFNVNTEKELS